MNDYIDSKSDNRTINNAVRHQYRVLSDEEKAQMAAVKDMGLEFIKLLGGLRNRRVVTHHSGNFSTEYTDSAPGIDAAIQKVQEAVFWGVWHITGEK